MKLEIGQKWISKSHPYENFEIYDGIIDTCVDSFQNETLPFDEQPEGAKIFFWQRTNMKAFYEFVATKKGTKNYDTSYPYAHCGESKKSALVNKIKKYNMELNKMK